MVKRKSISGTKVIAESLSLKNILGATNFWITQNKYFQLWDNNPSFTYLSIPCWWHLLACLKINKVVENAAKWQNLISYFQINIS